MHFEGKIWVLPIFGSIVPRTGCTTTRHCALNPYAVEEGIHQPLPPFEDSYMDAQFKRWIGIELLWKKNGPVDFIMLLEAASWVSLWTLRLWPHRCAYYCVGPLIPSFHLENKVSVPAAVSAEVLVLSVLGLWSREGSDQNRTEKESHLRTKRSSLQG